MFKRLFSDSKKRALLVDGPNILRDEFDIRLEDLREKAEEGGSLNVARVYLNHRASSPLIEAVETNGMEPVVTSGDVDVRLAVDAVELALEGFDLVIATRDADFKPAIEKAKEAGAKVLILGPSSGFSSALESVSDNVIFVE